MKYLFYVIASKLPPIKGADQWPVNLNPKDPVSHHHPLAQNQLYKYAICCFLSRLKKNRL